jgi:uncharacterized protein (TIGR00303 family)
MQPTSLVRVYTQEPQGQAWLTQYRGCRPTFACILGFTETGLLPGISAAGATPADRQYTAIADAEFLVRGPQLQVQHPLPPLDVGASPVFISRAVVEAQQMPVQVFNAGLPHAPAITCVDLAGQAARCLSTGQALDPALVQHLFQQGLRWGQKLAQTAHGYLILAECVVGGTTTALAVLTALGIAAWDKVNSSHVTCNHMQKRAIVQQGLHNAGLLIPLEGTHPVLERDPLAVVAAVGDPMQIVVAGMTIAASRTCGVLLAGGTQMLAVYALARAIAQNYRLEWHPQQVLVGTTRWVAEDPTGDTVGLAQMIGNVPLLASQLSFAKARYPQLQAYEAGYVKEGVGAGGCAIAAHLYQGWSQKQLLTTIEALMDRYVERRADAARSSISHSD